MNESPRIYKYILLANIKKNVITLLHSSFPINIHFDNSRQKYLKIKYSLESNYHFIYTYKCTFIYTCIYISYNIVLFFQ